MEHADEMAMMADLRAVVDDAQLLGIALSDADLMPVSVLDDHLERLDRALQRLRLQRAKCGDFTVRFPEVQPDADFVREMEWRTSLPMRDLALPAALSVESGGDGNESPGLEPWGGADRYGLMSELQDVFTTTSLTAVYDGHKVTVDARELLEQVLDVVADW